MLQPMSEPAEPGPSNARWLELRGRDYPTLGPLATAAFPDGGAIALSRGAYPKPYFHLDPNEDGALLLRDDRAALLCVVDGHNGVQASEVALETVLGRAADLIASSPAQFETRVTELVLEVATALASERRSRSSLLLATLRGDRCLWASFGDCALFRSARRDVQNRENDLVLGRDLRARVLPPELWAGSLRCEPGERIALTSDGVPNFISDPERITGILRDASNDAVAATTLARTALEAGAGDNVAVATIGAYPR